MAKETGPLPATPSTAAELVTWIQEKRNRLKDHLGEPFGGSNRLSLPTMLDGAEPGYCETASPSLAYTIREEFLGHLQAIWPVEQWVIWNQQFSPEKFSTVRELDTMMAWVEDKMAQLLSSAHAGTPPARNVIEGFAAGVTGKGVAPRDEWFLEQYEAIGADTYHTPAEIHAKWEAMKATERAAICPENPNKVSKSAVEQAIKRLQKKRKEKKPTKSSPKVRKKT